MNHNLCIKTVFCFLLLSLIVLLCGCVIGFTEEPYLDDRTEGWMPRIVLNVDFNLQDLDFEASELWPAILDFKPYTHPESVTDKNFSKAADEAVKLNLGSGFDENWKNCKPITRESVIGFINEDAAVVFDSDSGRLMFCAALKEQPALSKHLTEYLRLTVDAASLTANQLSEIHRVSGFLKADSKVKLEEVTLPLSAQGAFDLSVDMNVKSWGGTTPLAGTGGAFRVYYSENSNAMFVVTNTYVQAFDVETGKLLLMSSMGGKTRDGADESIKLDQE